MESVNTIQKLEQLDCDPIELSARIAKGEIVSEHKDYKQIKKMWLQILHDLRSGTTDFDLLTAFWGQIEQVLLTTPDFKTQSTHISNLIKYVAPALSSIQQETFDYDLNNPESIPDVILEKLIKENADQ